MPKIRIRMFDNGASRSSDTRSEGSYAWILYVELQNTSEALFDASRRSKKGLESSRDKNQGVYRSEEGQEAPAQ